MEREKALEILNKKARELESTLTLENFKDILPEEEGSHYESFDGQALQWEFQILEDRPEYAQIGITLFEAGKKGLLGSIDYPHTDIIIKGKK